MLQNAAMVAVVVVIVLAITVVALRGAAARRRSAIGISPDRHRSTVQARRRVETSRPERGA